MAHKPTISVRVHIPLEDIADLLYSANQGIRYWADCESLGDEPKVSGILYRRGSVKIWDKEEEVSYFLNLSLIKKGLSVMAKSYPEDFANLKRGDFDMNTGDVFVQCCLFGEMLYS